LKKSRREKLQRAIEGKKFLTSLKLLRHSSNRPVKAGVNVNIFGVFYQCSAGKIAILLIAKVTITFYAQLAAF
jgi:hypothetical protein